MQRIRTDHKTATEARWRYRNDHLLTRGKDKEDTEKGHDVSRASRCTLDADRRCDGGGYIHLPVDARHAAKIERWPTSIGC